MAAAEQKKSYAVVKNFTTLNTKANRTAIKDDEFSWIENVMPIGYGNLKAVPAQKPTTQASANIAFANTVSTFVSANINLNDATNAFDSQVTVVQNAIIGADNSFTGAVISVGTLVVTTPGWKMSRALRRMALWLCSRLSHQCETTYSGM